jgi:hypothetical protein
MSTRNLSQIILGKVKNHIPMWDLPIDASYIDNVGVMVTIHRQSFLDKHLYMGPQDEDSCVRIGKLIVLDYIDRDVNKSMGEVVNVGEPEPVTVRSVLTDSTPDSLAKALSSVMGIKGANLPVASESIR